MLSTERETTTRSCHSTEQPEDSHHRTTVKRMNVRHVEDFGPLLLCLAGGEGSVLMHIGWSSFVLDWERFKALIHRFVLRRLLLLLR